MFQNEVSLNDLRDLSQVVSYNIYYVSNGVDKQESYPPAGQFQE
jgi:hypothetical protein